MKANKTIIVLFIYHLIFVVMAYKYIATCGGDADLYWHHYNHSINKSWFHFFKYGTDFILFLNYPLVKMGLSFFTGFIIYGLIGFFGILKWMQWSEFVIAGKLRYKGINVVLVVFFLPNLHFWTATLGKEPIIFWGIASVIYGITANRYKTFSFIVGSAAVLMIRPHVALIFFFALCIAFLFNKKFTIKRKIVSAVISSFFLMMLTYMALQLSHIRYINWSRMSRFNNFSITSMKHSGSYVPMLEYNYGYRLFSFYCRPLFYDAKSYFSFGASFENLVTLVLFIISLYCVLFHFKKINLPQWAIIIILFTLISGIIYIYRYANLGLFMRTKIMFHPFFIIVMLYVISQGLNTFRVNPKASNQL